MYKGTLGGSQMKPTSKLEATVVHWGDNALRARAASVLAVQKRMNDAVYEIINLTVDRVFIFSWAKTMGKDHPSEARKMYGVFLKRLKVLAISNRIPWGISFPERTEHLDHWNVRVGDKDIGIYIEEESVDTEDNAEKSAKIVSGILHERMYDGFTVSPLSSGFHMKRIGETFERHMPKSSKPSDLPPSAEEILKTLGGKYQNYWELKEKSIHPKTKLLEVVLRIASRFEWGRKKIREITQKRVMG